MVIVGDFRFSGYFYWMILQPSEITRGYMSVINLFACHICKRPLLTPKVYVK